MPFDNPTGDTLGGVPLQAIVAKGGDDLGVVGFVASGTYWPIGPAQSCQCVACVGRMPSPPATGWFPGELTPEVRETLTKARALIAKGWTKGADARELPHLGRVVYCMRGAIRAVAGVDTPTARAALMQLARFCSGRGAVGGVDQYQREEARVVGFNDWGGTTHADVLVAFDRALE